ncbi:hypothetical protein PS15m_008935 [Mucor circinelloides]
MLFVVFLSDSGVPNEDFVDFDWLVEEPDIDWKLGVIGDIGGGIEDVDDAAGGIEEDDAADGIEEVDAAGGNGDIDGVVQSSVWFISQFDYFI